MARRDRRTWTPAAPATCRWRARTSCTATTSTSRRRSDRPRAGAGRAASGADQRCTTSGTSCSASRTRSAPARASSRLAYGPACRRNSAASLNTPSTGASQSTSAITRRWKLSAPSRWRNAPSWIHQPRSALASGRGAGASGSGGSVGSSAGAPSGTAATAAAGAAGAAAAGGGESSRNSSGSTEETVNYEISKTVKTSTVDGGEIKKLSVAVVVDGTTTGEGANNGNGAYKPRSAAEMAQITALVKSAMGFDQARGDHVEVTNMQFARLPTGDGTEAAAPLLGLDAGYWFKIIEAAILCLTALLIGLFVAKPLINRMFAAQTAAAGGPTALAHASPIAGALPAPAAATADAAPGAPAAIAADGTPLPLPSPVAGLDLSRVDGQVRES
ncbi:MAG: hypothetical protein KF788_15360, partial [Piscinibacter sp.]|nr:hypothetical protein [Piscinibacter sp.]